MSQAEQLETLIHQSFPYASDEELVEKMGAFGREGLEEGHAVILAVDRRHLEPLRERVGDAARFEDAASWYRRPGKTLAAYHSFISEALDAGAPGVRIVGEPAWPDGPPALVDAWARYESSLNEVLRPLPVWVICPYDTRRLDPGVVSESLRTHPATLEDGSESYLDPADYFAPPAEPIPPASAKTFLVPSAFDLRRARDVTASEARERGLPEDRIASMLVAVSEIVTNALRHGRTAARVWVWDEPRMSLVVQVDDEGPGVPDPIAGYRPPTMGPGGWGLWMAHQMADIVRVWNRPAGGTSARITLVR